MTFMKELHLLLVHIFNTSYLFYRCLDMQKSKAKTTTTGEEGRPLKKTKTRSCTACPYYNQTNITRLKERMLVDIMDMEDLVKCGKELKACPYYASRMAMDDAEVINPVYPFLFASYLIYFSPKSREEGVSTLFCKIYPCNTFLQVILFVSGCILPVNDNRRFGMCSHVSNLFAIEILR